MAWLFTIARIRSLPGRQQTAQMWFVPLSSAMSSPPRNPPEYGSKTSYTPSLPPVTRPYTTTTCWVLGTTQAPGAVYVAVAASS